MAKSRKAAIGKKIGLGFLETVIHVCVYIIVIFLFIRVAVLAFDFSYNVFGDPQMSKYDQSTMTFEIQEGTAAGDVAKKLEDAGLIKYNMAFMIKIRLSKLDDSLVPGTYELSPSMSADQILSILTTPVTGTDNNVQKGEDASGTITDDSTSGESGAGESESGGSESGGGGSEE